MAIVSSRVKIYSDVSLTQLVATVAGTTAASQTIAVTGLNPSTNYWAVAEATDNNGLTGYSVAQSFSTSAATYVFSGYGVSYSSSYDTLDVDIQVSCSGATFTACGIQFSTTSDFSGSIISGVNTSGAADDFVGEVSGFSEHTLYYYRYYATSTQYGTQYYSPTPNNTITTHYDEPTLTIGHSNVTDTTATVTFTYTGNMPVDYTAMSAIIKAAGAQSGIDVQFDHLVAGTPMPVTLSGLTPNTTYTTSWDVDYYDGEVSQFDSFQTLAARPNVLISGVSNITPSGATIGITIS